MPVTIAANTAQYNTRVGSQTTTPSVTYASFESAAKLVEYRFRINQAITAGQNILVAAGLPRGYVLPESYIAISANLTSLSGDLGWQDYTKTDGTTVTADTDGILDGLTLSTAGRFLFTASGTTATSAVGGLFIDSADGGWQLIFVPQGANPTTSQDIEIVLRMSTLG